MLEDGIVLLICADATVASIAPIGGFLAEAAKNLVPPTWTYLFAGGSTEYTLQGERGPRMRRLQIDAYGATDVGGSDAIMLSVAIDAVLDNFRGLLPDPDQTGVLSCLMEEEPHDFYDEASRTYRRMTEYLICY